MDVEEEKGIKVEAVIRTILKIIRSGYRVTNKDIVQVLNLEKKLVQYVKERQKGKLCQKKN